MSAKSTALVFLRCNRITQKDYDAITEAEKVDAKKAAKLLRDALRETEEKKK